MRSAPLTASPYRSQGLIEREPWLYTPVEVDCAVRHALRHEQQRARHNARAAAIGGIAVGASLVGGERTFYLLKPSAAADCLKAVAAEHTRLMAQFDGQCRGGKR